MFLGVHLQANSPNNTIMRVIRGAEEYDQMMSNCGLRRIFHDEPPFTEEFIVRYGGYGHDEYPEYLILGYQKFE